jgi:hypothetical protein
MSRKASNLLVLSGLAVAYAFPISSAWATEYQPGSGITNAAIKKQYDCQWFHISQSCNLKAKGEDRDLKCENGEWVDAGGDYISLSDTSWSGEGIPAGSTGVTVTWSAPQGKPTGESGVTVTATIRDSATSPDPAADDSGNASATKQMYAYEALAFLNCTPGDAGSASFSETENVPSGKKTLTLFTLYDTKTVIAHDADDDQSAPINKSANATWALRVNPSTATLGTNGQLKVDIGAEVDGTFVGDVYDDDWYDGEVTISVGISAGISGQNGGSLGVSVSTPISFGGDEAEAVIGMGFGFASDDLGTDNQDKLELKSSSFGDGTWFETYDSHGSGNVRFGYSNTATIRGAIGKESKAVASVQGLARAKTNDDSDDAKAVMTVGEVPDPNGPHNMPAHANYSIGRPTYEQGTAPMPGPESGY